MTKRLRLPALAALIALIGVFVVAPVSAGAQPIDVNAVPVTGSTDTGAEFNGTFDIEEFEVQDGKLVATGVLTGTLDGQSIGEKTVSWPVDLANSGGQADGISLQQTTTCDILHLELGPLDLDLLGLVVHLDKVVLDITAEQGEGNLLGNLLCAVAGLLDPQPTGGILQGIANLLNQILRALGG